MMDQRLCAGSGTAAGFHCSTSIDDSLEGLRQTRRAVARAKEGDREALRFLYVRYCNNIYGYVRGIVRDQHEAEDVTQQVFTKLITSIGKYEERGAPFFAWLLRLSRNVAIDHLRANSRLTPVEDVLDASVGSEKDCDRVSSVKEALSVLPSDQREVVVLRNLLGLTPGEIACRMGRTESAVHGLHHRGRKALRTELTRLDTRPLTLTDPEGLAA